MPDWVDLLQWPAMAVTVAATYLVASQSRRRRSWAFWLFLTGNALWGAWGWYASAAALIVLQILLAVLNVRGARKNDPEQPKEAPSSAEVVAGVAAFKPAADHDPRRAT